ncbi:tellurite resistance TerB family protein [Aurantimonas sp. VKM B-3413]|uniref:tellurite resistance TerB family protein n=1 Tax=Aurantimonas sp. VKM B-3413 TaxID=2779401 RepID=UPI001E472E80|nr:tellurite resistance TerB family protein [Aurantimonas sp. VKM B-3413]MCB8839202.1 tellurite resistance TerB family protein [Aurantimonas sp. VKM B-3413]
MDIQRLLSDFLGAGTARPSPHGTRPPHDRQSGGSMIDQVGGLLQGQAGSALSGALAGGLASHLFRGKGMKKLGGSAVKLGGAALIAGLAYKAYQNYQNQQARPAGPVGGGAARLPANDIPEASGTPFLPHGEEDDRARLMLSAMIAAAKADGYIDQAEQERIFGRIDELDLEADEKGLLMDQMRRPLSIDEIVAKVANREVAAEVYAASLVAIDPDHPAEKAYLDMLAARLELPAELVEEIGRTAGELQE